MSLKDELVENLGMSFSDVARIIDSSPARYFVFEIDKKTGVKRTIAQPARELKAVQRYVLEKKLCLFSIHDCAMAYMPKRNILENANRHVHSDTIMKLDFNNFFNSILAVDWLKFARRNRRDEIELKDLPLYAKILFWGNIKGSKIPYCLSIGAPTSPALSNIILFDLDTKLYNEAQRLRVVYTRYADDITASAADISSVLEFERRARLAVSKLKSPVLSFNDSKRGLFTKGGRRSVTGLVITPDKKVSVGRDRKRMISSMLHHFMRGDLDDGGKALLKGWLGFIVSVEPSFIESMRLKYGNEVVTQALRYYIPSKLLNRLEMI